MEFNADQWLTVIAIVAGLVATVAAAVITAAIAARQRNADRLVGIEARDRERAEAAEERERERAQRDREYLETTLHPLRRESAEAIAAARRTTTLLQTWGLGQIQARNKEVAKTLADVATAWDDRVQPGLTRISIEHPLKSGRDAANAALEAMANAIAEWSHTATYLLENPDVAPDGGQANRIDALRAETMAALSHLTSSLHVGDETVPEALTD